MHRLDEISIAKQKISSTDLMERTAIAVFEKIIKLIPQNAIIKIFCGQGNNGGDGLALSRLLFCSDYNVSTYIIEYSQNVSEDFSINLERLKALDSAEIAIIKSREDMPEINKTDYVVDCIFGSGLNRPVTGLAAMVIEKINNADATVISVDIPSGLFAEENFRENKNIIIADITITIELPFLSLIMPENQAYTGIIKTVRIGLDKQETQKIDSPYNVITPGVIKRIIKPRKKFSHKGTYGHSLIIAGSREKCGAAVLCVKACHRAGSGLVTAHVPKSCCNIIQISSPETMLSIDNNENIFSKIDNLDKYNSVGIGPGLGTDDITELGFRNFLERIKIPVVVDADALNLISINSDLFDLIPENSILTPHPKEFERLAGKTVNNFQRLELMRKICMKRNIIMLIKGVYTAVCTPHGDIWFNTTGNPGMATAGSGDVLTGIITGLLAQNYTPVEAALIGVYLHGKAGDRVKKTGGEVGMIASDLINHFNFSLTD